MKSRNCSILHILRVPQAAIHGRRGRQPQRIYHHVLLALVDVDEDDVDDGGGNLSHEENFFLHLPFDIE